MRAGIEDMPDRLSVLARGIRAVFCIKAKSDPLRVRSGSKADNRTRTRHVRFTSLSGRMRQRVSMSALGQKLTCETGLATELLNQPSPQTRFCASLPANRLQ